MPHPNRNETFGRLLSGAINSIATYEGRTAPIVEEELGQMIGIAGKTIQRYKAGHLPPEDQTVEILAEAAIKRGYLGREWLQRFLRAARYPFADKLLDRLCPLGPARPRPPRVYENLPAPTYSQFVMRQQPFDEVLDGLTKRSAAVLIVGLGGNGKTSLAREVADRCLTGDGETPQFDAVVWVSDKDRPGTTNLSIVLDEIARTLDYPGFTQFEFDEKRREVENLLRRLRVLIVIDNFETITDGALLAWLLNLPEPSKALLTIREYRREFRRGGWPVELRGMTDTEAREFVTERLRVLRIEKLISEPSQLEPLIVATGGNPKAIELTLGLVKYERRPLQQVVDDLYAARGELFDDLFTRAWALLDEAARRVLLVLTFFPASASSEALSVTADVQGFTFDRAVERLADLALLDVQQEDLNSTPCYALHSLVRAFAGAKAREDETFEQKARERQANHFLLILHQHGGENWQGYPILDAELANILSTIRWCYQAEIWDLLIEFLVGAYLFLRRRGYWDDEEMLSGYAVEACHKTGNRSALGLCLRGLAAPFYSRREYDKAERLCLQAKQVYEETGNMRGVAKILEDLGQIACKRGDLRAAWEFHKAQLSLSEKLGAEDLVASALRVLGDDAFTEGNLQEAKRFYEESRRKKRELGDPNIVPLLLGLGRIAKIYRDEEQARILFSEAEQLYKRRFGYRHEFAELRYEQALLEVQVNNLAVARGYAREAQDIFHRLAMYQEAAEVVSLIARLDEDLAQEKEECRDLAEAHEATTDLDIRE